MLTPPGRSHIRKAAIFAPTTTTRAPATTLPTVVAGLTLAEGATLPSAEPAAVGAAAAVIPVYAGSPDSSLALYALILIAVGALLAYLGRRRTRPLGSGRTRSVTHGGLLSTFDVREWARSADDTDATRADDKAESNEEKTVGNLPFQNGGDSGNDKNRRGDPKQCEHDVLL